MRVSVCFFISLALGAFAPDALADNHTTLEKPSFQATQRSTITATVTAIDHDSRVVSLRMPEGDEVTFTASEEARNLGQVEVGDIVTAEYVERVSIKVLANDGSEPATAGMTAIDRTAEGEMPGMAAVDTQVVTATVEDINLEANTFKLKFHDGAVEEYFARNPENLKRAAVGDLVVMSFTEAVAISVTEGERE